MQNKKLLDSLFFNPIGQGYRNKYNLIGCCHLDFQWSYTCFYNLDIYIVIDVQKSNNLHAPGNVNIIGTKFGYI